MHQPLKKAIIRTLAYFDLFDLPLTAEELYRFLWKPPADMSYEAFLFELPLVSGIEERDGLYTLSGRTDIVADRRLAIPLIEEKLRIAKRAAMIVRFVPFLSALFVCNTVASASASRDSDIDVFIVARHGRLWLVRLLTTTLLSIARLRRTRTRVANKICLSFYVTDAHLDVSDIAIDEPDIYLMYWIDQLVPIYDPDNVRERMTQKNSWVKRALPHAFQPYRMSERFRVDRTPIQQWFRRIVERLWRDSYGGMLERQAKHIQKKKMATNRESVQGLPDTRVVINDTMLKFHENDRRQYYRDAWRERVSAHDANL